MPMALIDSISRGLADALGVHQRRQEVLATNLANVETPGFRAGEVDFRTALRRAFDANAAPVPGDAAPEPAALVEDTSAPARADGNTVDLDLQMAKLSENAGRYTALARILSTRLALMRSAITEGGR
jgi:flagellar basal-body rod protein FlgB